MRSFLLMITLLGCSYGLQAQTDAGTMDSLPVPVIHRTFLFEPVQSIEKAVYKTDGEELRFELSPDGESVVLPDYEKRRRVLFTAIMPDGSRREIEKSPCDIFEEVVM